VSSESADGARLQLRIADLMHRVQRHADSDIPLALDEIAAGAAQLIPGAQYAAITVTGDDGAVATPASTHRYPEILDDVQYEGHVGPSVDAARDRVIVRIDDLTQDGRWPQYRVNALERTPIRSVLVFPLTARTHALGALGVYSDRAHAFDDAAFAVAQAYATHASLAWDAVRRKEQFQAALATRDIIGQAKGMIMERYGCDSDHAFDLLKRLSQETNTRLRDLARQLVEADRPVGPDGETSVDKGVDDKDVAQTTAPANP
jgi:GAF domain-containing protein